MSKMELIKAIAATAELCGARLTEAGASMLVADLSQYPHDAVLQALSKVRRSPGRFSLGAIVEAMEARDGRPGADEAWAMIPQNERDTAVWTPEMSKAWGVAAPLLEMGDKIGARMAFKDAYGRLVQEARENGVAARWEVSLGLDPNGRESAIRSAVEMGRISSSHATALLPAPDMTQSPIAGLLTGSTQLLQTHQSDEEREESRNRARENLLRLKAELVRVKGA